MDGMGHQLFARTRLAVNQHASVCGRHDRNLLAQRLHGDAFTHDHALGLELFFEFRILQAEPVRFQGVFQDDESLVQRKRFFQKVKSAQLGCTDSGFNGCMAGDHDYLRRSVQLPYAFQRVQPVYSGEPYVEQHDLASALLQLFQTGLTALGDEDFVSFVFQNAAKGFANVAFVVHHQDVMHSAAPRLPSRRLAAALRRISPRQVCFLPREWSRDGLQ